MGQHGSPAQAARLRSVTATSQLADPFAVNPIRRSLVLVGGCAGIIVGAALLGEAVLTIVMLSVGWLAISGLVIGTPILVWSLAEEGIRLLRRRLRPTVEQLDVAPRLVHILLRHGYEAIEAVDRASDAELMLLSNMDRRGLREVRRAIALWHYRRWQEAGFPADGRG
jgi:hypothetical protein